MSNFHGGIELIPLEETLGGSERWMGEVIDEGILIYYLMRVTTRTS